MNNSEERVNMDARETANLIGVSEGLVWMMVKEKTIPTFKLRGRRLFNRENIINWNKQQGQSKPESEEAA